MMTQDLPKQFTRRERQIMDIVYERGQATASEIMNNLPDPPSYSAVRALVRILEEKGFLKHEQRGGRYVFTPTVPHEKAKHSALKTLLQVFFNNSTEAAVTALLDVSPSKLTTAELDRLSAIIEEAKRGE
jgi:predicted transcriptional regulator